MAALFSVFSVFSGRNLGVGFSSSRLPAFPVQKLWQGATLLSLLSPVSSVESWVLAFRASKSQSLVQLGRRFALQSLGQLDAALRAGNSGDILKLVSHLTLHQQKLPSLPHKERLFELSRPNQSGTL